MPTCRVGSRIRPIVFSLNLSLDSGCHKSRTLMGSLLGDWPSHDPHNFSQLRPSDPSNPSKMSPATYHPTHNRTLPPPDQVITTGAKNILLRNFYERAEEKLRQKRAASEHLMPEHVCKQARVSTS